MKYHIELHLWVVIFATFLKIAEVLVTLMKYALYATEAHIHDSAFNIISFNLLLTRTDLSYIIYNLYNNPTNEQLHLNLY